MKISVIFSTYNSPAWLEKVLWGFHCQTDDDFEVVIADDGSAQDTRDLIESFARQTHLSIQHIWQEDNGFQKCRILNKAIIAAKGDYLVMTDGDCVPREDFVAVHREEAEPGYFLSGGYFKLPMCTSKAISLDDVKQGKCFNSKWLEVNGVKPSIKFMKLTRSKMKAKMYNALTLTKRSWNGHNSSCFKSDALRVNGFDERMKYGGLDREFGARLMNVGLKAKQIRYSAICVHLDHARAYDNNGDWERNYEIRNNSIRAKLIETPMGIRQHGDADGIPQKNHLPGL